jgi:hypothetical protein
MASTCLLVILMAIALTTRPSHALATEISIQIVPPNPLDSDPIHITAFGEWPDACAPKYMSHQVQEHGIRLDTQTPPLIPPTFCAMIITPWAVTIDLAPLASGVYTAEVYINNHLKIQNTFLVANGRTFLTIILATDGFVGNFAAGPLADRAARLGRCLTASGKIATAML